MLRFENELLAIAATKKKAKVASFFRVLLIIVILCGVAFMFTGVVIAAQIIYLAITAVLLALALPQLAPGQKYEELLNILESKARAQHLKSITKHITRSVRVSLDIK